MPEPVESYAEQGRRLWQAGVYSHNRLCPCLVCADTRRALGMQPLRRPARTLPTGRRVEARAS